MTKNLFFLILVALFSSTGLAQEQTIATSEDEAVVRSVLYVYENLVGQKIDELSGSTPPVTFDKMTREQKDEILYMFHSQYSKVLGLQHNSEGNRDSVMDYSKD